MYAQADSSDADHEECLELLATLPGPLIVPQLVIAEVAYLLARRMGDEPERRLIQDFAAGSVLSEPVNQRDWTRIAELLAEYPDLRLGSADASVVAAAERLNIRRIATLDDHFRVVRPRHCSAFDIVP
ncbi:MAG TPA: PIN domain-containing protein [Chloroflexota bacterium]|nr:PIN domain-containing protein [Chloroflexota bacterium]